MMGEGRVKRVIFLFAAAQCRDRTWILFGCLLGGIIASLHLPAVDTILLAVAMPLLIFAAARSFNR